MATRPRAETRNDSFTATAAERGQAETCRASVSSDKHLRTSPTGTSSGAILHPFRIGGSRGDCGKTVGLGIKMKHLIVCPIHL